MLSQAVQDYLKTIFHLQKDGPVSTTDLANELKLSSASVTGMLKRLDQLALVNYNSYKGVTLSDQGNKTAIGIIRNHRLLETYLYKILGYTLDKIHPEACMLEHFVSEHFTDKIDEVLEYPKYDPHGHPIPTKEGEIEDTSSDILMCDIIPGQKVVIKRLEDHNPELLAYLEQIELMPDVEVEVTETAPFQGPLTIIYNNEKKLISHEIAKNLFVRLI
ncbi:MAG: metal-dependent transcriptional regulator [Ignavibacteria bacterium]|nr:metal-dependent transcriptional regulator [Ignavibacteria bacterium]